MLAVTLVGYVLRNMQLIGERYFLYHYRYRIVIVCSETEALVWKQIILHAGNISRERCSTYLV